MYWCLYWAPLFRETTEYIFLYIYRYIYIHVVTDDTRKYCPHDGTTHEKKHGKGDGNEDRSKLRSLLGTLRIRGRTIQKRGSTSPHATVKNSVKAKHVREEE